MTMLVISTWLWGERFDVTDVQKLSTGFSRNLEEPHRFICFSDRSFMVTGVEVRPIEDILLTMRKGCFARLRMFDPDWQQRNIWPRGISERARLVNVDLDTVITNKLDGLFPAG